MSATNMLQFGYGTCLMANQWVNTYNCFYILAPMLLTDLDYSGVLNKTNKIYIMNKIEVVCNKIALKMHKNWN